MATDTRNTGCARTPTSRRRLLGGAAAALIGAGFAGVVLSPDPVWGNGMERRASVKLPDPDAHLLSLCAAYHTARGQRATCSAAWDADEAAGHVRATNAEWEAAWDADCDTENAAADAVLPVSPTTLHGLAAKAAVVQSVNAAMRSPGETLNFDETCADQVLADTLALAGRA